MTDFSSLGLSDWLVKQCKQLGIHKPTAVQENCVPAILQGKLESWMAHVNTTKLWCHMNILWTADMRVRLERHSRSILLNCWSTKNWWCRNYVFLGRDCMGCAKTGSGKTAAFVLPVLQKLSEDPYGIFCLVLTPTRSVLFEAEPGRRQNPNIVTK